MANCAAITGLRAYSAVMDFWQQIIVGFVGSVLGAGVALSVDYLIKIRDSRFKETSAINGLTVDLNQKRGLVVGKAIRVDRRSTENDRLGVRKSVEDARSLIREARLQLRPQSKAFDILANMGALCNTYLHYAGAEPENYLYALKDLNRNLDVEVQRLGKLPGVIYRKPGKSAYAAAPSWDTPVNAR